MELKKLWVRGFKSLRDTVIDFPTKLTIITGPSGSGKTALTEALEALQTEAGLGGAAVGVEIWDGGCCISYELSDKKSLMTNCSSKEAEEAVRRFINGIAVIRDIDWKAVRSPPTTIRPVGKEPKLLPDASNFVQFLYGVTGGEIPDSLVEALRYVMPSVSDLKFATDGGALLLKLTTEDGAVMTQATMPSGVLKTLIIETALMTQPVVVIDNFDCGLDPETQQFLIDEFRSHDIFAIITTYSDVVLDYAKSPQEVVMFRLVNGETKARRLGGEVEEALKRHKLTLSELIASGLLEPL
jgi:predicted ATPase